MDGAVRGTMSDSSIQRCEQCGGELPPGIPPALCPRCVMSDTPWPHPASAPWEDKGGDGKEFPRAFGNYELLREISRGGMGVVYLARQESLRRLVAIKMLIFGAHSSVDSIRRFQSEAVLAGGLHHPHIVPIHEVGLYDGQHFIVMDFVDGPTLAARLRAEPMVFREAAECVRKVAGAIHFAHERNVLHRDLKPSNVLLDAGEPRVSDFGLARRLDGGSMITVTGQMVGSPSYVPPEQVASEHGTVSRRSDVYGLGAILYECLTGRAPFRGEKLEELLHQVLHTEPVAPHLLNPLVPRDLETICLKCLEKEPARRYETALEVEQELTRFAQGHPILARPLSRLEKLIRWARRNPTVALAISFGMLCFLSGFAVSIWQADRAGREARAARLSLYVADMNLAQEAVRQNNFSYAREKLRAHLPERGWPDLRGWEWRHLWARCASDHLLSFDAGVPVTALALSAEGTLAVVARRDGQVRVLDFLRAQFMTNFPTTPRQNSRKSVATSPDGGWLALADGTCVRLARPGLREVRELTAREPGNIFSVAFTPDGGRVLAASSTGLKAWDVWSGEETAPPVVFPEECRLIEISPDGSWFALATRSHLLAWNLSRGQRVLRHDTGVDQIESLALADGGWLALGDRDGMMSVWSLPVLERAGGTNPAVHWDTGQQGPVFATTFSHDGRLLALAGSDQLIRLYATSNWQACATLKGHDNEVWALAFTHDGGRLVSAGKDGQVKVWNPRQRPPDAALPSSKLPLGFTPDSRRVLTLAIGENPTVQFWDTGTRELVHVMPTNAAFTQQFTHITPDGRTVLAQTEGNIIRLLDPRSGQQRDILKLNHTGLQRAWPWDCSPDSTLVAIITERTNTGRVALATEVFHLGTLERITTCPDLTMSVFSPDGRQLGGWNSANQPVVWQLDTRRARVFSGLTGAIKVVTFSHRPGLFAASSMDGLVSIWDADTGRLRHQLKGHRNGVGEILFSQDDRTLFSTSTDRTLRLWNVATGQELLALRDAEELHELALSPDDTTLAVGPTLARGRPVKLWHAPPLAEIDAALAGKTAPH